MKSLSQTEFDALLKIFKSPEFDDAFPQVNNLTLAHAQCLLMWFAEDETQSFARRSEAAQIAIDIAYEQTSFTSEGIEDGNLDPFFQYGGGAVVASMLVDAYKKRWPYEKCTGTFYEREFMPYIYECACSVLEDSPWPTFPCSHPL
jgi:hypothetical protein